MCPRPDFDALHESATAVARNLTDFTLSSFDHRGRGSTLLRGPTIEIIGRGMYRPIIPPISPRLSRLSFLEGFLSSFRAKTRLVDGFRVETNPPRNQVSSAAHRDIKRRAMTLFYDSHGLNAPGILLMHFDFAPQSQKLPLGVLLYALLASLKSLAVPPRFSSTSKNTTTPSVRNGEGRSPICPEPRLRLHIRAARGPHRPARKPTSLAFT
ncbi:hypothetical protein THAOC_20480 [Thalassiosira oceanica]|uniref:Uncharacterized protein n=1 Tax=Thalassiosira oceanica TaxID=159749 RepID=K0S267_THAOC|nr:hypothetical protein THAOC_20480 [Thalassiosira oceanica]|eukprot:EJK59315.1 hypothetical protein THAOC_20480 [Thalassiosira oceanica]